MIPVVALVALQSVNVDKSLDALKAVEGRTEAVMTRVFACIDDQVKVQMTNGDIVTVTPESIVDGALAACQDLRREYEVAETAPEAFISAPKAHDLADQAFQSLRKAYVDHITELMAKPQFAEARTNIAIARWRKCITDKAANWSRLKDEASTVAQASVTACEMIWPDVQRVLGFVYRSKGLAASGASDVSGKLHETMRDVATETVISERAKRLPKR